MMYLLQGLKVLGGVFGFFPLKASLNIRDSLKLEEFELSSSWSCCALEESQLSYVANEKANMLVSS